MTRPALAVFRPFKNESELLLGAVVGNSLGVVSDRRVVVVGGGGGSGAGVSGCTLAGGLLRDLEGGGLLTFGGEYVRVLVLLFLSVAGAVLLPGVVGCDVRGGVW